VEPGESGGITNRLYVNFEDEADEPRFYSEEVPTACLIPGTDVRNLHQNTSAHFVERDTNPSSDRSAMERFSRPYCRWFRGVVATLWTRLVSMEVLYGTVVWF
jgi:hypothetical protein